MYRTHSRRKCCRKAREIEFCGPTFFAILAADIVEKRGNNSRVSNLEKRSGITFGGPSDSRSRHRRKAANFAVSRVADLEKPSGIIFGGPFDSRGRH